MVEKQASSEIAQSREKSTKVLLGELTARECLNLGQMKAVCDLLILAEERAERDTRERCAELLEAEARDADRKFMPTTRNALKALAERIRGKE